MKKLVIGASLILASLAATPTFAATHHSRAAQPYSTNESGYDANAAVPAAGVVGFPTPGGEISWDPDPNIRSQLIRDSGDVAN